MDVLNIRLVLAGIAACVLSACGGGGGGGGVGAVSVAVTDAPVDGVADVWVEFYAVTLKPADDNAECVPEVDPPEIQPIDTDDETDNECEEGTDGQLTYTFDTPRTINLKALTDGKIELLFGDDVPAGRYNWMKLHVNAEFDGIYDSYVVEEEGGMVELRIPPDRLKLGNHFTVVAGGESRFVIDWNLRMGLTDPVGQPGYKLQPSLRITDMVEYGTIAGTVDMNLLPPANTDCSSDLVSGAGNVVYIYRDADVTPDDIDNIDPDPLTTADVKLNIDSGNQEYMATFLKPGPYTVAFTCQGSDDVVPDPEQPNLPVDDALIFTDGINATVEDDLTTIVDFNSP
jgi:hypothetical protein